MRGERTVILSTHILPEVEMICSRVVIISAGRIAVQGTPEELAQRENPQFQIVVRGERKKLEEILAKHGKIKIEEQDGHLAATIPAPPETDRPKLARQIVEAGLELHEFHLAQVRLEDVFLRSTARAAKE
jgi:ABC-2 type transport system ATP-binding protein